MTERGERTGILSESLPRFTIRDPIRAPAVTIGVEESNGDEAHAQRQGAGRVRAETAALTVRHPDPVKQTIGMMRSERCTG